MQVKFKKLHPDAVIPSYAHKSGDAGLDITTITNGVFFEGCFEYKTGLAVEIPEDYVGLIFPRSSVCKTSLNLSNCVGVIDSNYRGEILFKFRNTAENYYNIRLYIAGDRIGQLVIIPYPTIEPVEAEELSETNRGTGSYGSTGN